SRRDRANAVNSRAPRASGARAGFARAACSQADEHCMLGAADHRWRCFPVQNCTVDLQIPSAARPPLGIKEILRHMSLPLPLALPLTLAPPTCLLFPKR